MLPCYRPPIRRHCQELWPSSSRQHRADRGNQTHHALEENLLPPLHAASCRPVQAPPNLPVSAGATGPETCDPEMEETVSSGDGESTSPSPGGGPCGESFISFVLFRALAWHVGTQNISKRAVSSVSGSQEEDSGEPCITGLLPSSVLASSQQWVAQEHSILYCILDCTFYFIVHFTIYLKNLKI